MNKFLKSLILIIMFITVSNSVEAISVTKIDKLISNSKLNDTATIAVSIRNASHNNVVYEKNENKLLHPASTLKIISTFFAVNTLGYDYKFKTGFYIDSKNNLYIKLGADPTLTTAQLKAAFQNLKEQKLTSFNNLYIDDSIIDKKEFANGWMMDDEISPYTPKVSAYNLDGNTLKVNLINVGNGNIKASVASDYPISVYTNLKTTSDNNAIDINRYCWNSPEVVEIYGKIKNMPSINIPISSMRRYFIFNLNKIVIDNKINIKSTRYASKLLPSDAKLVYEISHPITSVLPSILQNSNNLGAETIFKLAGGKQYNSTGSEELALFAMKEFYKDYKIDFDSVIVKDGAGVSRNNLVSATWMSEALSKIYKDKNFEQFKDYMAKTGDGTLSDRLFELRGEAWLKTGSLSNISAISGYINSNDGHTYAITIFTQNFTESQKSIKDFEDKIITLIYNR